MDAMKRRCSLVMLTSPRDTDDQWKYLRDTLRGIEDQGVSPTNQVLISDGLYAGPPAPGWQVLSVVGKPAGSGNRDPWFHAIHIAHSLGDDALCLEDDIEFAPGALRYMLDFKVPGDLGFVQFFASKAVVPPGTKPGLVRAPIGSSRFLQAVKYSRSGLLSLDTFRGSPTYKKTPQSADQTVAAACKAQNIRYAIHVPSLVQHVGVVSKNGKATALPWWKTSTVLDGRLKIGSLDASRYQ
jgi:hypothetical protein